jgi:hypothetical protein
MNLNVSQLVALAQNAGWSGSDLATAVAIALAESSGNPNAYNPETASGAQPGQGSYGLWQIYLTAHPEDASQNLYDPQTNANDAYAIYSAAGNSFAPWSTFKSGAYLAQVPAVGLVLAGDSALPELAAVGGGSSDFSAPDQSGMLLVVAGGVIAFLVLSRYL